MAAHAPSGLDFAGELPWGAHVCQFFRTGDDLRETLVPYFKAGLENNERCLLVAMDPFSADDARSALRAAVGDFDRREKENQIEIHDVRAWYNSDTVVDGEAIVAGLLKSEEKARADGYVGLRTNGNIGWVHRNQWTDFQDYEARVTRGLTGRRMISMCSYCLDACSSEDVLDVVSRHSLTVGKLRGGWSTVAGDRQSTLVRELDHRIKNNLATIQAIAGSTIRNSRSLDEFRQAFNGRIGALSRTHSLLTDRHQSHVPLRQLLVNELEAYADGDGKRVVLSGPDVVLPAHITVSFGMAIHELTTNALKYGALSVLGGELAVSWDWQMPDLRLLWRENNVPLSTAPQRAGFGTQLLKRLLPAQLGAEVAMNFEPDGLKASISMPLT
ncbi:MAG: MEDS domain-containing protein [Pseudolabrys sp.]|nr:MEDS domain-containing protein [Pseudolabrys sp.]